jgi:hypothetical protein
MTMLEEIEAGGPISKSTIPRRPGAESPLLTDLTYGRRSLSPAAMLPLSADASRNLSLSLDVTGHSRCSPAVGTTFEREIGTATVPTTGRWLGALKVKIEKGLSLITHQVGHSAEMTASNPFCVVVFGRQQRSTGVVKKTIDPEYGDEFMFDVYEEDVPTGFLASPDRRARKKASLRIDVRAEELKAEKRQRALLLRRVSGQVKPKKSSMLTEGIDLKHHDMPWDELFVEPGPDNCQIKVHVFHTPSDSNEPLESLGMCSISALDLVRESKGTFCHETGRLVHPDPTMMARGIVNISMSFLSADKCASFKPPDKVSTLGTWHTHDLAGTHPRPSAASGLAAFRWSTSPDKTSGAFAQVNLLEDLPWKKVEHESEWKVRVRAWDKTNTRRISLAVQTGIRHSVAPVAVSEKLREQARIPRLLVYYIEKKQHALAHSAIKEIRKKQLPVDAQVAALIDKYEEETHSSAGGLSVYKEPSFEFGD